MLVLSALALGRAPFQCGEADPAMALEETPGEAVYQLAGRFRAGGDTQAWEGTLRFLLERYPSSRFAVMAAHDLEAAGLDAGTAAPGSAVEGLAAPGDGAE